MPEKLGLLTAILSTGMSLFAAIASGISVPLAVDLGWGWRGSLAFWVVFMLLALAVWFPQAKAKPIRNKGEGQAGKNVWKSRLAWQVTLFMGAQSVMYFTMVTWLPDMLISKGMSPVKAGIALSYMQLISLIGTFFCTLFTYETPTTTRSDFGSFFGVFFLGTPYSSLLKSGCFL